MGGVSEYGFIPSACSLSFRRGLGLGHWACGHGLQAKESHWRNPIPGEAGQRWLGLPGDVRKMLGAWVSYVGKAFCVSVRTCVCVCVRAWVCMGVHACACVCTHAPWACHRVSELMGFSNKGH